MDNFIEINNYYQRKKVLFKGISAKLNEYNEIEKKLEFLRRLVEVFEKNKIFLVTVYSLVETLQDPHFIGAEEDPLFTCWFLKYSAEKKFQYYISNESFKHKITTELRDDFIKAEIKKIKSKEDAAKKILHEKNINIYDNYNAERGYLYLLKNELAPKEGSDIEYIEILRVLAENFYTTYRTPHGYNISSPEVKAYFEHILLKPYLEKLLKIQPEKEVKSITVSNSNYNRPNRTDIAYCIYYQKESKELELKNPFPSDASWKEINILYKKNWKNIQTIYNLICRDKDSRLKKSKVKNIEYVIENMLDDFPNSYKLAKDELVLAELNS